jgi:uncharacterized protein (DUF302 family)
MRYSYSKDLQADLQEAERKVREALLDIGFGALTEINMKDAFKAKLDLDYRNYKIIGIISSPKMSRISLNLGIFKY